MLQRRNHTSQGGCPLISLRSGLERCSLLTAAHNATALTVCSSQNKAYLPSALSPLTSGRLTLMLDTVTFLCHDTAAAYCASGHQLCLWLRSRLETPSLPHLFHHCWLVCQPDNRKNTKQIHTNLGWRIDLGPEQTPLTFDVDPQKDSFFINFSGSYLWMLMKYIWPI